MTAQREAFEAQRLRFEAWATKSGWRIGRLVDDEYHDPLMRSMFSAWQAAEAAVLTAKPVAWANRAELRDMPFAVVIRKFQTETSDLPLYTKETS